MALKINLKPGEKIIIGGAVIKNGDRPNTIYIENKVPLLREKDIMKEEDALTYCSKIYFVIQLMYIDGKNMLDYHRIYWKLVRELVDAVPRTTGIIDQISQNILEENYYQALKLAKKLMEFEKEVLNYVKNRH
ncbi:MAG: flagellar biosynthesis repressor FlbT [Thermodesulfovibrionales bacterium]|nr:flagellar biosynthesis repressor FlbT [Thermodesulfovibrionales bacterium]